MKLNNCCYKAIKHHQQVCPVCQQILLGYEPQQMVIKINTR